MFDKKSEYALNKYDQDSIIYISVSGRIRLTRADFSSEEEFLKWKAWSDADYHQTEGGCPGRGKGFAGETAGRIKSHSERKAVSPGLAVPR